MSILILIVSSKILKKNKLGSEYLHAQNSVFTTTQTIRLFVIKIKRLVLITVMTALYYTNRTKRTHRPTKYTV